MLRCNPVHDSFCRGIEFEVTHFDDLVEAIALILVQEYDLARRLVTGVSGTSGAVILEPDEIEDIIARRLRPEDIFHRDGFVFQLMMWLAAHIDLPNGDLVALPHTQGSAKGQDSIIVHRSGGAVVALSICEDKATQNPRKTVRDEVWPEIADYESGGRRDELRSNVIATLGPAGIPTAEAIELIRQISWAGSRRYRVRVTVAPGGRTSRLFKGFDELVNGDAERRRGETVQIPWMRAWMEMLARKVEDALRRYGVRA